MSATQSPRQSGVSAGGVLADACFACGRKLGKRGGFLVDTRDGQEVFIGPECFKHVQAAGDAGYQPPKGGPRLWPLSVAGVLADMDRCTRELPGQESEILYQARAAVAELLEAAGGVTWFDWSDNDDDAVASVEHLRAARARCKGGAQ